jgi:UDP-GlcNAc3NAcA epimerase
VKVLSIVGNRPQFIKSAPLSVTLREREIEEVTLHTGQHFDRELSAVFFEELGLAEPRYRLGIDSLPRDEMLARMEPGIADALMREQPDWALVYGDTNSTLAGARAAAATGIRLAHVESGLRSGDWTMPEEHNRVETDRLAQLLLCPDERSRDLLAREEVDGRAEVVGDVMRDACERLAPIARSRSSALADHGVEAGRYAVTTVHREANVQQPRLGRIVEGLNQLAEPVVFPAHPRTRAAIASNTVLLAPHVGITPPLGYLDFAALVSQARVVLTDSGGLQKEAYWYGVPCVTMRPSTEWADTVAVGANTLVDDDPDRIATAARNAHMPDPRPDLYGDGRAAAKIAGLLYTLS